MSTHYTNTPGPGETPANEPESFEEGSDYESGMNDITPEETALLDSAGEKESANDDDQLLSKTRLDDTDEDGEELNEGTDLTGSDLDVPNEEGDEEDELNAVDEDEENSSYSTPDQED